MTNLIVLIIGANNATPRLQPDLLAMPDVHTERAQHQFIYEGTIAVVAFASVMTYHINYWSNTNTGTLCSNGHIIVTSISSCVN